MCQYHRKQLPAAVLDDCIVTHRSVRIDGPILLESPFYELPETAIRRIARSEGIEQRMNIFSFEDGTLNVPAGFRARMRPKDVPSDSSIRREP